MIKKNPRPRWLRNRPGARDPIDPRPDRSNPSNDTIADARANIARRTPANRTREKPIEPRSAFTDRLRRRVVVIAQPFPLVSTPPAKPYPESGGLQKPIHLASNYSSNMTTLAVSVANGNARERATDGWMPTTGDARAVSADRAPKKKVNLIKFAHLFFSTFLAEALTATGAALICVAEMTNIILLSCSRMTLDRSRGWASESSVRLSIRVRRIVIRGFLMGLGFYLNLHVLNDLWMCILC